MKLLVVSCVLLLSLLGCSGSDAGSGITKPEKISAPPSKADFLRSAGGAADRAGKDQAEESKPTDQLDQTASGDQQSSSRNIIPQSSRESKTIYLPDE